MFEIIIVEKTTKETESGGEWRVIEENSEGKQYGYTPFITKSQHIDIERFRQCVDVVDITAVIKAVNGI